MARPAFGASMRFTACVAVVLIMTSAVTGALGIRTPNFTSSMPMEVPDNVLVPALVVFGDSTVDAGNNNYMTTIIKADFPPYGTNYEGGRPTGRFTDGKLVTDFVSDRLGIPLQLPYLHPAAHGQAIVAGINFASSASGWFQNTASHFNVEGLDTQMVWFRNWKKEVLAVVGPQRANYIFTNALYAFSTGSNDWVNNYYLNPPLQKQYPPEPYIALLLGNARKYTQEVYDLGGRNFAILGLPPLGCLPAQITLHGKGQPGCVQSLNDVSRSFNVQLISLIADMQKTMKGSRLIYIDIYTIIYETFQNPTKYGFKYARDGCCGTGDLEVALLCNRAVPACSNPDEHLFWDSFHPTSHLYRQIADQIYSYARPILLRPSPNP